MSRIKKGLLSVCLSLAFPLPGNADQLVTNVDEQHQLSAAMNFGGLKADIGSGSIRYSSRIQKLDFVLAERVGPTTTLGFSYGKAILTQEGRNLTAGKSLVGSVLGLGLQQNLWREQNWQLDLLVDYSYQLVDHADLNQSVKMGIHQAVATTGLSTNLNWGGRLQFGLQILHLWGEEIASGTLNHTLSLDSETSSLGYLGYEFELDNSGAVGLLLSSGEAQSSNIYFKRQF